MDIPLGKIVGVAGVSGSGKSSLALGVLYAEGSRRYLEALSTYTRRRMTQATRAQVDEALYVPAALALHQRPGVPGIRSTFGTGTELLNSLRLLYSRLASHRCPNGHYLEPTLAVAAGQELICPECGAHFYAPSAEELAFNSQGACRTCGGTGIVRTVDRSTLVPDESLTINEGAVAPWNSLMWSLMTDVCRAMGVRTNVPFRELTEEEKAIVYDGPAVKKHILYRPKNGEQAGELDFTYYSAVHTVENALAKVKDEKGMKRVEKFLKQDTCPDCGGTRLCASARQPRVRGISLDEACKMTLSTLVKWVAGVPETLPEAMRPMAASICESFANVARRLMDLGLGYLALDRAAATLSTGERQRMQLARAVRNRTTGVLYVLDEPSIGLHPANIVGLTGVMRDLVADGNSVLLVDHDAQILAEADHLVEMGPGAGAAGGHVIAQGTVAQLAANPDSRIGPFLRERGAVGSRARARREALFDLGRLCLSTGAIHTVHPLEVEFPKGRLSVVTGVSGSGKTTLILESLIPALEATIEGRRLPEHVRAVEAPGISHGQAYRRHAHRHQRALHGGHLRQRPRRIAQDLRPHRRRQKAGVQGRGLFLQHGQTALPHLRRHRRHQPGRAVFAGRGHPLPRLPRLTLRQGRGARALRKQRRGALHSAGIDGHGRTHGAEGMPGDETRLAAPAGAGRSGTRLPDARRRDAQPFRRRSAAAEAGQRDGPGAGRFRVRL